MKKAIYFVLLLLLTACYDYPRNRVSSKQCEFIIYKAEAIEDEFMYAITDDSNAGWALKTTVKFDVGDTLILIKK